MTETIKSTAFACLRAMQAIPRKMPWAKRLPGVRLLYDFSVRAFWPYPPVLEVEGSKMYLNVREKNPLMRKTFQSYALSQGWEEATTKLFKEVIRQGDAVVDVGANIGYFTLLAARLVGERGKVYAFEPEPANYRYLQQNIALNGYGNVHTYAKAVSDERGTTKLYLCPYDSGHHTINQYEGIRQYKPDRAGEKRFVEVETVALDDYFGDGKETVNVMKMDVEGAEALALRGMDRMIRANKDLKIFFEFFPLLMKAMGSSPETFLAKLLGDYGFSLFVIEDEYSMEGASGESRVQVHDVREALSLCREEKDHLNMLALR